jgi:hypothetical protein
VQGDHIRQRQVVALIRSRPRFRSRCRRRSRPPSSTRLRGCHRLRRFFRRPSTTSTQAKLLRQPGSSLRIRGCCQQMLAGQTPPSAIFVRGQHVPRCQVASKHAAGPPAFEAGHAVVLNRSPDRNRRGPLDDDICDRFSKGRIRLPPHSAASAGAASSPHGCHPARTAPSAFSSLFNDPAIRAHAREWACETLRCSACEGHEVDFVVSGARR